MTEPVFSRTDSSVVSTDLHKERLAGFLLEEPTSSPSPDAIEHLGLEEELEEQLAQLKAQETKAKLFPDDVEKKEKSITDKAAKLAHDAEVMALEHESRYDEETLETVVICGVIAGLLLLPQLFSV